MSVAMYLHVPFCNEICAYCDFTRCKYHESLAEKWLDQIQKELLHKRIEPLKTLYIGGGTPSALSTSQLDRLCLCLKPYTKQLEEYSVEANAESLDDDKIALLKNYGVNRISLGAQSFDDGLLAIISRKADFMMIKNRITALHQAGIHNISIDLMYGLPTQSLKQWQTDLQRACTLDISHISLYALSIEEHSEFGRKKIKPCEETLEADMYELAIEILSKEGYEHYEISSFAKPGKRSKHNMMYWHYENFYGIGCGASGKEDGRRYDNTRNLHTYLKEGSKPEYIPLSKQDEMFETLMMSLRMQEGILEVDFETKFSISIWDVYGPIVTKQIEKGLLLLEAGRIHTSRLGMMLLNDVLTEFL